jgi:predicted nucleotidyltransferase
MTSGAIPSRVLAALEESVCPDSDVTFVVAFGSQVSGEPTRSSDLDLAVTFSEERFEVNDSRSSIRYLEASSRRALRSSTSPTSRHSR